MGVFDLCHFSEGKKYTPKMFSALKTQVPQQAKKRFGVYQKACFQGKKEGKYIYIYIYQRASKVVVGDPFAQYWCIDFGVLISSHLNSGVLRGNTTGGNRPERF